MKKEDAFLMKRVVGNPRILSKIFSAPRQIKFCVLVKDSNHVNGPISNVEIIKLQLNAKDNQFQC